MLSITLITVVTPLQLCENRSRGGRPWLFRIRDVGHLSSMGSRSARTAPFSSSALFALVCPRSGLSQREVHDPAPTHVRPSAPAVVENLPARAAGGFESVGQVWHHDRIVPDARAFGYASDESSLIMWHTPSGNRILIGAEAELFRAGLASLLSSRRRLLHRGRAGPFARGVAANLG